MSAPAAGRRGRLLGSAARAVAGARARSLLPAGDGAPRRCPPPRAGRGSRRDARRARRAAPAPGARRLLGRPALAGPPGPEEQRPPRPPRRLGRAAAARRPPPQPPPLAEPAALRFPGSASGEPLLPAPSGSCGGRVSRGRARRRRRRRRRRGEGGRALPRGRDWRQPARGEGGGGGGGDGPEPGPGASPADPRSVSAAAGPAGGQRGQPRAWRGRG
ncbi:serine/arginine repetitive matrix protein 3-like [Leopardus geoffroyi]|uniref:serine/arginine repetitive matrix protein 3-like n=1 Tax=Leopardus geoffroyi TaxID=46844 RepID=UPI001E260F4A|nr:serine/arginine repetitive matrix protein 3-like [Leopardus geoffroyi]